MFRVNYITGECSIAQLAKSAVYPHTPLIGTRRLNLPRATLKLLLLLCCRVEIRCRPSNHFLFSGVMKDQQGGVQAPRTSRGKEERPENVTHPVDQFFWFAPKHSPGLPSVRIESEKSFFSACSKDMTTCCSSGRKHDSVLIWEGVSAQSGTDIIRVWSVESHLGFVPRSHHGVVS